MHSTIRALTILYTNVHHIMQHLYPVVHGVHCANDNNMQMQSFDHTPHDLVESGAGAKRQI